MTSVASNAAATTKWDARANTGNIQDIDNELVVDTEIEFQNGPIKEFGVNGISNESLLAIVIDRLRGFQSGEYACEDNQIALESAEYCLNMLQKRTKDRLSRGVEGTNNK